MISTRTLHLHLALTPWFGGKTVSRVAARNALLGCAPERFLKLSVDAWREEYGLNARQASALDARRKVDETAEIERQLDGMGATLVTAADAHYPDRIEAFDPDPPGVLFLYGNLSPLKRATFCVLASRGAQPHHWDWIERLAEEGVLAGEALVSGHERVEYQRSAVVPLRWGAPRILCLDRGLQTVLGEDLKNEAFRAARLWRYEFDPKSDLAISPFRPKAEFIGDHNRVRDRLIASLSDRMDVVHMAEGGNMARLVQLALRAGRRVRVPESMEYAAWRDQGAEGLPLGP